MLNSIVRLNFSSQLVYTYLYAPFEESKRCTWLRNSQRLYPVVGSIVHNIAPQPCKVSTIFIPRSTSYLLCHCHTCAKLHMSEIPAAPPPPTFPSSTLSEHTLSFSPRLVPPFVHTGTKFTRPTLGSTH